MEANVRFEIVITNVSENAFNCYIPEIDTHFFAKTYDEIESIGSAMVKGFISFYSRQNKI